MAMVPCREAAVTWVTLVELVLLRCNRLEASGFGVYGLDFPGLHLQYT